jgi:phenylalanyl-tRNA synthetase alpha chain
MEKAMWVLSSLVGPVGRCRYGCEFKREEAFKNLLRTHTTAISAQMLYK